MSSTTRTDPPQPARILLEQMSDQELTELRQQLDAEFNKREARQKREARKQIVELAQNHGIDLSSLADDAIKYRDPENQFNVWSGRGRKPEWVRKALEKGIKLDDLKS